MAKARNKKIVSLFDFIATGKLDVVEIGQTKEFILNHFCKPDDKNNMGNDFTIWRYSSFELHFEGDNLFLLWCDSLKCLKNPHKKQFRFDKWVFKYLNKLTFSYFCSILDEENLVYSVDGCFYQENKELPDNLILKVNNTDVVIYFEDAAETAKTIDNYYLIGIGASQMSPSHNIRQLI